MTNEPVHRAESLAARVPASALRTLAPCICALGLSAFSGLACSGPGDSDDRLEHLREVEELDGTAAEDPAEQAPAPDDSASEPGDEPAASGPAIGMATQREPFRVTLPGTTVEIEMQPVVGGTLQTAAGAVRVEPFWMASTETTWDAFDVLVYRQDLPEAQRDGGADGVSRPTKPYISVDRGFGHAGFPALSMSLKGAQAYCEWLSKATGRHFRLPTPDEFDWAARGLSDTPYACGEEAMLPDFAWYAANSDRKTHAVGQKQANTFGLFDLHGNTAEWAVDAQGQAFVCGGSFKDSSEDVSADARVKPSPAWNASDPQMPKSTWWLADANFVGFRVVCDGP